MGVLSWILIGLVAGYLAKAIMPGRDPGGTIVTILLGLAGSLVGGFAWVGLGFGRLDTLSIGNAITAVLGSLALLVLFRMAFGRGSRRT